MRRHPPTYTSSFSAGPGPLSTAIKAIIIANVVMFFASEFSVLFFASNFIVDELGLQPFRFLHELRLWQPVTYMFLHAGIFHILFNMLGLWLIGTELERIWGMRYFVSSFWFRG
jgi:membrane associated rhomboid family serine protease